MAGFTVFPDLILMDGGQRTGKYCTEEVLQELELYDPGMWNGKRRSSPHQRAVL